MASRHLSIRLDRDAFDRLDAESRRKGQTRSQVAKTLLDEGLRMEQHPGIVFRPGPAGRRPALAGGPDVWEVARLFQDEERPSEDTLHWAAKSMALTEWQVSTALRYYAEYQDEVDDWILRVDEEAARAEAAWKRQRSLLER